MEWWLWLVIVGNVLVVGMILYMVADPKEEKPKEEKRLRDGHEGEEKEEVGKGGDAHYWCLTGDKEGECKFDMAYAEAASAKQFDWDAIYEGITTIAFDAKVSEFVPPEEKPEKKPKEEEKAE